MKYSRTNNMWCSRNLFIMCVVVGISLFSNVSFPVYAILPAQSAPKLKVIQRIDLDIIAGLEAHYAVLAPNGEQFVYGDADKLCLAQVAEAPNFATNPCASLAKIADIDPDSIRWSPDSTKITFTTRFFALVQQTGIWIYDTAKQKITRLTGARMEGVPILKTVDYWADVNPVWKDDQTIWFMRANVRIDRNDNASVFQISLDGSTPTQVFSIPQQAGIFSTNLLTIKHDGSALAYNYGRFNTDEAALVGLWLIDANGQNNQRIQPIMEAQASLQTVEFSPDGQALLLQNVSHFVELKPDTVRLFPEMSAWRIMRLVPGDPTLHMLDGDHYVRWAGWSPTDQRYAFITKELAESDKDGLYIGTLDDQPYMVLAGKFAPTTPLGGLPLQWARNHVILVSNISQDHRLVLLRLGEQ